jgi:hypothetical protein
MLPQSPDVDLLIGYARLLRRESHEYGFNAFPQSGPCPAPLVSDGSPEFFCENRITAMMVALLGVYTVDRNFPSVAPVMRLVDHDLRIVDVSL